MMTTGYRAVGDDPTNVYRNRKDAQDRADKLGAGLIEQVVLFLHVMEGLEPEMYIGLKCKPFRYF